MTLLCRSLFTLLLSSLLLGLIRYDRIKGEREAITKWSESNSVAGNHFLQQLKAVDVTNNCSVRSDVQQSEGESVAVGPVPPSCKNSRQETELQSEVFVPSSHIWKAQRRRLDDQVQLRVLSSDQTAYEKHLLSICPDILSQGNQYNTNVSVSTTLVPLLINSSSSDSPAEPLVWQKNLFLSEIPVAYSLQSLHNAIEPDYLNKYREGLGILRCESLYHIEASAHGRCVAGDSPYAARERGDSPSTPISNIGTCLFSYDGPQTCGSSDTSATTEEKNRCEVRENCYWKPVDVNSGKKRESKYSLVQVEEAEKTTVLFYFLPLLIYLAGPTAAIGALVIVGSFLFFLLRCACNLFGGREPKIEGYTVAEKVRPFQILVCASVALVAVSLGCVIEIVSIKAQIPDIISQLDQILQNFGMFGQRVSGPATSVVEDVRSVITDLSPVVNGAPAFSRGYEKVSSLAASIIDSFSRMGPFPTNSGCINGTAPSYASCVACSYCQNTLAGTLRESMAAITAHYNQFMWLLKALEVNFVENGVALLSRLTYVRDIFGVVSAEANWLRAVAVRDFNFAAGYLNYVAIAVYSSFALEIITLIVASVSLYKSWNDRKARAVNFLFGTYAVGVLLLFISFIGGSTMLLASMAGADICQEISVMITATNFSSMLGNEIGDVVNTCFNQTILMDHYGISELIPYVDYFNGSSLDAATIQTSQQNLRAYAKASLQLRKQMLGWNPTYMQGNITTLNSETLQFVSRTQFDGFDEVSVLRPWTQFSNSPYNVVPSNNEGLTWLSSLPSGTPASFTRAFIQTWYLGRQGYELDQMIAALQYAMTELDNRTKTYGDDLTATGQRIGKFKPLVTSIASLERMRCEMRCSWIIPEVISIHERVCGTLLRHSLTVSVLLQIKGFVLLVFIFPMILLQKRLRAFRKVDESHVAPSLSAHRKSTIVVVPGASTTHRKSTIATMPQDPGISAAYRKSSVASTTSPNSSSAPRKQSTASPSSASSPAPRKTSNASPDPSSTSSASRKSSAAAPPASSQSSPTNNRKSSTASPTATSTSANRKASAASPDSSSSSGPRKSSAAVLDDGKSSSPGHRKSTSTTAPSTSSPDKTSSTAHRKSTVQSVGAFPTSASGAHRKSTVSSPSPEPEDLSTGKTSSSDRPGNPSRPGKRSTVGVNSIQVRSINEK